MEMESIGDAINGTQDFEHAGTSLALSGDGMSVAVGAPGAYGSRARVAVYILTGSVWQNLQPLRDNDGDQFGFSVSLSTNGTRLTVGAKQNDAAGNDAGSVRVYDWKPDTEKWVGQFDILAEAAGDAAGFAVSMAGDGSRVAIGAPGSDANGTDQVRCVCELEQWDAIAPWPRHRPPGIHCHRRLRLRRRSASASSSSHHRLLQETWYPMGDDRDGEEVGDNHGGAVSLSGDGMRLAVGAKKHDDGGADTGHARVYRWLSSSWDQLGGDLGDEVGFAAGDQAGSAVSLSKDGSRVAVGAAQIGSPGKGKVRVFQHDDASSKWAQLGDDLVGEDSEDTFSVQPSHSQAQVHVSPSVPCTTIPPV